MSDAKCMQATPHGTLLEQIMDSTQPKNEREWAARREIESLRQRVAELEEKKEMTMEREQVWGVAVMAPKQKEAATKHCFGDCGKISMAGAINDEVTGGLFVCCQPTCPYEAKVIPNYGETMSFGRPHTVHLRLLEPERG